MILTLDNEYCAVLDACVLVPMPLCDTLLRCAEEPALFRVAWSETILEEVQRTLRDKFNYTQEQASRRGRVMREAFPEAAVNFPNRLILALECIPDPKDRHVAAAAIHGQCHAIVTNNLKHFPIEPLAKHNILVQSADEFLVHQFHLNRDRIMDVLDTQASAIGKQREYVVERLRKQAPNFVEIIQKKASL
jgi:predicted nucleic acid-binding protein